MFSAQDIQTLEVFAYNRMLVRRFAEALPVYELLAQLEEKKTLWQLAIVSCFWHLGALASAQGRLGELAPTNLTDKEKLLFTKLSNLIQRQNRSTS